MPVLTRRADPTRMRHRPALSLLGGFSLRIADDTVALPLHARRVLAFLSLDKAFEPDCDRGILAERLWPDAPAERSRASLRTALWRIRQASPVLVDGGIERMQLGDSVEVDVHRLRHKAERLLSEPPERPTDHAELLSGSLELLPGWDEVWLLLAREQLRQLRLHALEVAARRLITRGHYQEAIDVLLAVVAEEPLRESAQAKLIDAHLCEGNVSEARRQLALFAALLWDELEVLPSSDLYVAVGASVPSSAALSSPRGVSAAVRLVPPRPFV